MVPDHDGICVLLPVPFVKARVHGFITVEYFVMFHSITGIFLQKQYVNITSQRGFLLKIFVSAIDC